MNELLNEIMPYVMIILTAIAGYLATRIKVYIDGKIDKDKQAKLLEFVGITVNYVEQIGFNLQAEQKFALAKAKILIWTKQKGLAISEEELEVLIEAFVHNLTITTPKEE